MCLRCFYQICTGYPFKGKKAKTVLNGFIEIVNKSKVKRNKLWVDQGRQFYNNRMQKWL